MNSELASSSGANRAVISLGSNIDPEVNLMTAVKLLSDMTVIISVSSVYETTPIGHEKQPNFWNAAVLLETELGPLELSRQVLADVESRLMRVRSGDKNAPRTIDADLSLFNHDVIDLDPDHQIPAPDLTRYAYVIVPIAELIPGEIHPVTGQTFQEMADLIMTKGFRKGLVPPKSLASIRLWEVTNEKSDL